jgi:hypothetical protein
MGGKKILFKGQDHRQMVHQGSHAYGAALSPGPNLGADVIKHPQTKFFGIGRQTEIEVRKINENEQIRAEFAQVSPDAAHSPPNLPRLAQHLADAYQGQIFGPEQQNTADFIHSRATDAAQFHPR